MTDPIFVALITTGGIVVGTLLTSLINFLQVVSARRFEERKIVYDIASKLAIDQWKLDVERTDAFNANLKDGGIFRMRSSLLDFQVPIPHVAQTVRRIAEELERSTRPGSWCQRFRDWRAARQKVVTKKKKEAEQAVAPNGQ